MKCKNCKNLIDHWCEKVIDSPDEEMDRECKHYEVMSNADRIKNMSVEELAELLNNFRACSRCPKCGNNCFPNLNIEQWLESEVTDNA